MQIWSRLGGSGAVLVLASCAANHPHPPVREKELLYLFKDGKPPGS